MLFFSVLACTDIRRNHWTAHVHERTCRLRTDV
jgi:hypothetical protein